jgi:hypothetical protein
MRRPVNREPGDAQPVLRAMSHQAYGPGLVRFAKRGAGRKTSPASQRTITAATAVALVLHHNPHFPSGVALAREARKLAQERKLPDWDDLNPEDGVLLQIACAMRKAFRE